MNIVELVLFIDGVQSVVRARKPMLRAQILLAQRGKYIKRIFASLFDDAIENMDIGSGGGDGRQRRLTSDPGDVVIH